MADWSLPSITSLYQDIITFFKNRDIDCARWFATDYADAASPVIGTKRWNATTKQFEEYKGTSWDVLNTDAATVGGLSVSQAGDASSVVATSSTGKLGLGTASPSGKLTVVGDIRTTNTSDDIAYFQQAARGSSSFGGAPTGAAVIRVTGTGINHPGLWMGNSDSGPVAFYTNNLERMRVDATGNVGIGTTNPQTKLSVSGTNTGSVELSVLTAGSASNAIVSMSNYSAGGKAREWYQGAVALGDFGLYNRTDGHWEMFVSAAGNVGIGTTSPNALLHVGATTGTNPNLRLGQDAGYRLDLGYNNTAEYGWIQAYAGAGAIDNLAINPSGGGVLIGTTTDNGSGAKLQVNGDISATNISTTPANGVIPKGDVNGRIAFGAKPAFRGALAFSSLNASINAGAAISEMDLEYNHYDTDSMHSTSSNTGRIYIPSGVTKIRLNGYCIVYAATTNPTSGNVKIGYYKNGSAVSYDQDFSVTRAYNEFTTSVYSHVSVNTPVMNVTGGDYFTLAITNTTNQRITTVAPKLSIEIIE